MAKGCCQKAGLDYEQLFAPVAKVPTFRLLMAMAARNKWYTKHLDVKTAFLHGKLEEEVFMEQPEGFQVDNDTFVCKLDRAVYGLKQASRVWYIRLRSALETLGFQLSEHDAGLFIRQKQSGTVFLIVWVDDILMCSTALELLEHTLTELQEHFDVNDLGPLSWYLGMKVEIDRENQLVQLSQHSLINDVLRETDMQECKPVKTSLPPNIQLETAVEPKDGTRYRRVIGKLLYLATCTRPDTAYAVSYLSKFSACPSTQHWDALKHLIKYIKGTKNLRLTYNGNMTDMTGYSDSDFAGDINTRKSTSGYAFIISGAATVWGSKQQREVVSSTSAAEYLAANFAGKETLYSKYILRDLGLELKSPTIFCDNNSCLKWLKDRMACKKSKHIDTAYHFTRSLVERKEVKFTFCKSSDNVADMLTKSLPAPQFMKLRAKCGLMEGKSAIE